MANIVPIQIAEHKNLKVSSVRDLAHANNQHIVPISASEYAKAAASYPIVLVKEPNGNFRSVVMLGLEENENLYTNGKEWNAIYIPQSISMVPFVLGQDPEKENTLTACINIDSPFVGEDKDQALFDADGKDTEFFTSAKQSLGRIYNNEMNTDKFLKELASKDLLVELELDLASREGEKKRLTGLFGIDEKKIEALSDEDVLDFHKRGLFIPIHAMLMSLGQIHRLAQLRNLGDDESKRLGAIRIVPVDKGDKK